MHSISSKEEENVSYICSKNEKDSVSFMSSNDVSITSSNEEESVSVISSNSNDEECISVISSNANVQVHSLKVFSINICVLISKLKAYGLEEKCQSYGILCFSESMLDEIGRASCRERV